jgi:CheY-like chemotaxis protein
LLQGWLTGKKVMVVDDTAINRKVASRMLEVYGCGVQCISSGADAVAAFETGPRPDLILMDVQMPEMVSVDRCCFEDCWI